MIPALKKNLVDPLGRVQAKVFLCDACCCGDPRFSATRAPMEELKQAIVASLRNQGLAGECQVAMTGCMGPCEIGNNVILATKTRNFHFRRMNQPEDLQALGTFVKDLS